MEAPFSCLVVDDDELCRTLLEHYIGQHDGLALAGTCASAVEAANVLAHAQIDLLFLDVEMPDMTGLEFLGSLSQRPQVVLVTSKEEYALQAFDVDVTDFLLKPVAYARFLKAVERVRERHDGPVPGEDPTVASDRSGHVFIKSGSRLIRLDLDAVEWIEAQSDYMLIHTGEKEHLVHSTMKAMEEKLSSDAFARVHRSFIVRIDRIDDIEDTSLVIGRKVIPIGASYRERLLSQLKTL
jgi:DNA-binding LytR/AlgR family response regulator